MNQTERGNGYRYYVEQAAAMDCLVGAHWFQWQDQSVTGRMDGENYNIGFVDPTNRAYPELVEAAKKLTKDTSGKGTPDQAPARNISESVTARRPRAAMPSIRTAGTGAPKKIQQWSST